MRYSVEGMNITCDIIFIAFIESRSSDNKGRKSNQSCQVRQLVMIAEYVKFAVRQDVYQSSTVRLTNEVK